MLQNILLLCFTHMQFFTCNYCYIYLSDFFEQVLQAHQWIIQSEKFCQQELLSLHTYARTRAHTHTHTHQTATKHKTSLVCHFLSQIHNNLLVSIKLWLGLKGYLLFPCQLWVLQHKTVASMTHSKQDMSQCSFNLLPCNVGASESICMFSLHLILLRALLIAYTTVSGMNIG